MGALLEQKQVVFGVATTYIGVGLCCGCEDRCGLLVSSGIEITGTTIDQHIHTITCAMVLTHTRAFLNHHSPLHRCLGCGPRHMAVGLYTLRNRLGVSYLPSHTLGLPKLDGVVVRSGGQAAAVRAKRHALDAEAVPRQRGGSGAVAQPPELDGLVARCTRPGCGRPG